MKKGKKVKLIFKKGKQTSKEAYKVKGNEVTNSIEDSIALTLKQESEIAIDEAKAKKKDYQEVVVWELEDIKEEEKKK